MLCHLMRIKLLNSFHKSFRVDNAFFLREWNHYGGVEFLWKNKKDQRQMVKHKKKKSLGSEKERAIIWQLCYDDLWTHVWNCFFFSLPITKQPNIMMMIFNIFLNKSQVVFLGIFCKKEKGLNFPFKDFCFSWKSNSIMRWSKKASCWRHYNIIKLCATLFIFLTQHISFHLSVSSRKGCCDVDAHIQLM